MAPKYIQVKDGWMLEILDDKLSRLNPYNYEDLEEIDVPFFRKNGDECLYTLYEIQSIEVKHFEETFVCRQMFLDLDEDLNLIDLGPTTKQWYLVREDSDG